MATRRQVAANRRNAKLSTGPTSVTGKAISSGNALKSGIHAQSEIIRDENPEDLEALRSSYYQDNLPATSQERAFVDILVASEWMLRRFRRIQAEMFEYAMREAYDVQDNTAAAQAFDYDAKNFERLQRQINATQRNFHNALKALQLAQASACRQPAQAPAAQQPAQASQPLDSNPLPPELGSFLQILPPAPTAAIPGPVSPEIGVS